MLVWISHCPSPQEIRDRLLADSEFESQLLGWLEACHFGDFATSTEEKLAEELEEVYYERQSDGTMLCRTRLKRHIRDPATTLPRRPPSQFSEAGDQSLKSWHRSFLEDTDRVVFCSNRHDRSHGKGCWRSGDPGYCCARFPRELFEQNQVDRNSGAIRFAKKEAWINTYNIVLSNVLRSNSDLTCLLSGTQVKAIIAYVTDYVTKSSLTTHGFFETVRAVLDRNTDLLAPHDTDRADAARALVVKIVNALSGAAELGGPAVCAYLLGNPDHYTSEVFKVFHWRSYVRKVRDDVGVGVATLSCGDESQQLL
ncbi:hypothetical protein C2E23DRAFT_740340 [Lenzites betulinus]|nr:hypothetical protein C2E23DRAFT_740340 [Lenzites betulinus]